MSWIRDKFRKDIQDDLVDLVEEESVTTRDVELDADKITDSLRQTTSPDTVETLQNKFSLPIVKKKIKLL